jgi:hypothetical protein
VRCNDEFDARDRDDYDYEILCPHRFEDERLFAKFEHYYELPMNLGRAQSNDDDDQPCRDTRPNEGNHALLA